LYGFQYFLEASAPVLWSAGVLNQKINQIAIISTLPYSNTPKTAEVGRNVFPYIKKCWPCVKITRSFMFRLRTMYGLNHLYPGVLEGHEIPKFEHQIKISGHYTQCPK